MNGEWKPLTSNQNPKQKEEDSTDRGQKRRQRRNRKTLTSNHSNSLNSKKCDAKLQGDSKSPGISMHKSKYDLKNIPKGNNGTLPRTKLSEQLPESKSNTKSCYTREAWSNGSLSDLVPPTSTKLQLSTIQKLNWIQYMRNLANLAMHLRIFILTSFGNGLYGIIDIFIIRRKRSLESRHKL